MPAFSNRKSQIASPASQRFIPRSSPARSSIAAGLVLLLFIAVRFCAAAPEPAFAGKPVGHWIGQLASEDIRVRWYACYALGELGDKAADAVEPLAKLLEDKYQYEYVRGTAAWALGRIAAKPQRSVPLLTDTLDSKHLSVRRSSPEALAHFGKEAQQAVPKLKALLKDPDPVVRVRAAGALWAVAQDEEALTQLAATARRGGFGALEAAMELSGAQGDAGKVTAALVAALGSEDGDVRRAAAGGLGRLGQSAIPALKPVLSDARPAARRDAVAVLSAVGAAAVGELIATLKDDSADVRRAAVRALGALGRDAASAESALEELADDPQAEVRAEVGRALSRIRP